MYLETERVRIQSKMKVGKRGKISADLRGLCQKLQAGQNK
jgi:hypothetical protein